MAVTSLQVTDRNHFESQIERIIQSQTLRRAESLCKLLRYLAEHSLNQPGLPVKEYQIATEVFGRPRDFDPQVDSAIRVQAGRLRLKLLDYYNNEGANDSVIVSMPNGVYGLSFSYRESPPVQPRISVPTAVLPPAVKSQGREHNRGLLITVICLSAALATALGALLLTSPVGGASTIKQAQSRSDASPALRSFWSHFASSSNVPWIIFSNAAFVGRPETGMRYKAASDSGAVILDHYTGVGEVLAVHELDKVFARLNHPVEVKRGSLFTLDDAKKNDLIFIGSPSENLSLLDLPGSQEFVFRRRDTDPHKGDLTIVNVHPDPGQPAIFYPSDSTRALTEDYAVVALFHGLDSERRVLILAGTTTIGTQAAVEYVCAKDSLSELLRALGVQPGSEVKPFEALLRVKVTRGVPVSVQLVGVRHRD